MQSAADDVRSFLKALVLLELEKLRDQEIDTKPELLLYRAGISMPEIAEMLGKKYMAVAKTINRAKGGSAKERLQKTMSPSPRE
jgi:transposase